VSSHSSRCIALPRLLPGRSYKNLDDARVGKGHVTASAVTQQLKNSPACQIKGLLEFAAAVISELSRFIGSSQPRKVRSEDEELTCD
jgi:hypothetical protein